jgi:hypothetical protein
MYAISCYRSDIVAASRDLVRTVIAISKRQQAWLRQKAYDRNASVAAIVRDILDEARRREQPQEELPLDPQN